MQGTSLGPVLAVAAGGALGASARHLLGVALVRAGVAAPWGVVVVNVLGSGLLGVLVARQPEAASPARLLIGAGVLGGFTTFSTFAADAVGLGPRAGSLYVVASVLLALLAYFLGKWAGSA